MALDLVTRSMRDQHARPCMLDVQVHTKSWLEIDGRFAIGPHGFELLAAIQRHQSLTRAACAVGWSYRHAWDYLRQAEHVFGRRLVSLRVGKGKERGMALSAFGRDVLRLAGKLRARTRVVALKAPSAGERLTR